MEVRHGARRLPTRPLAGLIVVTALVVGCSQSGAATTAPTAVASAATAQTMGSGTFHDVDGSADGQAKLVVKPDGAYAVVLEDFRIESIDHTNVVLVSNADVTATADVDKSMLLDLGPLKAPEGMQDFIIPSDMSAQVMEGYHAVVIWDTEMAHAIAAAPLR